ncbi:unnamed protein product [Cunninghamella echinulata]
MGILNGNIPLQSLRMKDKRTEEIVLESFIPYAPNNLQKESLDSILLERQLHIKYVNCGLQYLGRWLVSLDASRPWLMYWIGIDTLKACQHSEGGFGGGPGQLAHLATTYAAVNSLAILGTNEAYDAIDRKKLYQFLLQMKQPDGSFTMHHGGEIDIRGSYCALSVASLTNLLTPELMENCGDFIVSAQTFEGGIGPYPGKEAHNGYTFCGLAAIEILGEMYKLNMDKFMNWCTDRQMKLEGGFQGRSNKLVDGCYSFWGAGDFPLINAELIRKDPSIVTDGKLDYFFDREALQEYILLCCQSDSGGLIDKPGKGPDHYHTCYCLSGLSTAQHQIQRDEIIAKLLSEKGFNPYVGGIGSLMWKSSNDYVVVGDVENLLAPTHPIHNIPMKKARGMIHYFYSAELESIKDLFPLDDEPIEEEYEEQ